ncbi:MAG: hypothetical protein RIB01_15350 [Balneola sp.]
MKNIIVTDYNQSGENVIIFCDQLSQELIKKFLEIKNIPFTDVAEVKPDDLQYYLYEPVWFREKQEREVIRLVTENEADSLQEIEFSINSPDGFAIHWENFKVSKSDFFDGIKKVYDDWKNRYARQGYYSSNTGKIKLDELHNHCTFIQVYPDPDLLTLPIHKKNLSFL